MQQFRSLQTSRPCGNLVWLTPLHGFQRIMQLQKYDAEGEIHCLYSEVLMILYSLFCGAQLLQNIVKSTQLQFPLDNKDLSADCKDLCQKLLRRSPVERLTFEEFFNHPFLSQRKKDESLSRRRSSRSVDGFPFSESNLGRNADDNSQEDCLPFLLDDDSSGLECSPFVSKRMSPMKSTYGFSVDSGVGGRDATSNVLNDVDFTSRYDSARQKLGKC
ncbi:hypothetical protein NC652_037218 [Populus alba x Populus x berolinensis]|nr:hypothetical protein NC652_037218 [Populus alba x Populus x berolinensis]